MVLEVGQFFTMSKKGSHKLVYHCLKQGKHLYLDNGDRKSWKIVDSKQEWITKICLPVL